MTAINSVVLHDCVHLVSDGAATDPTGKLAHLIHKVTPIAHLNVAIGVRGTRTAASMIIDAIAAGASSYDELQSRIADILRSSIEPTRKVLEPQFGPHALACDVVVGGWSQTRGLHAYVIATSDANAAHGLRAWTPVEIAGTLFMPGDEPLTANFARLQLEFSDAKAIELVTRQRAMVAPSVNDPHVPGPHAVGGFVQLTTVRRDSIETRILHRWPDVIGQGIQP
jgi:hypothetical protein